MRKALGRGHCQRLDAVQLGAVLEMVRTISPHFTWFLILKGVILLMAEAQIIMLWNGVKSASPQSGCRL